MKELKEALKKQEAEIEKLRNENDSIKNKERENISVIERQERIIIEEINRECQKTAEVLGVTARKTNVPVLVSHSSGVNFNLWRIQDFSNRGAPDSEGVWQYIFTEGRGRVSSCPPPHLPMTL